jgi:beta-glucosidase
LPVLIARLLIAHCLSSFYLSSKDSISDQWATNHSFIRYNKVEGIYTCETPLLADVIRGEWKYDGAIMSDWFGTVSTVPSILAGQDLEMPGPPIFRGSRLVQAVKDGLVSEDIIDQRATRMLEWIDKVTTPASVAPLTQDESVTIARQVASEGVVLLKNHDNLLPLNPTEMKRLAVLGVPAADPPLGGGGSSLAPAQYVRTPLEYLKLALRGEEALIRYARGVECNKTLPLLPANLITTKDGQPGVAITYRNNSGSIVLNENQAVPQVMMLGYLKPQLDRSQSFTYEMETIFVPETTGRHTIGVRSTGQYSLFIDNAEVRTI